MAPANEHQTSIVHKQGNNFEISAMADCCIFVCLSPPRLMTSTPSQISSAGTTVSKALISLLRAKMPENAKKAGKKSFKTSDKCEKPECKSRGESRLGAGI